MKLDGTDVEKTIMHAEDILNSDSTLSSSVKVVLTLLLVLIKVDEYLQVNTASGKFIHLQKSEETFDLQPDWCGYNVIG